MTTVRRTNALGLSQHSPSVSECEQNEFIELLVLQILDPIAKRIVESPSPSRLYLFPRLLDKCISVVIEYVGLVYVAIQTHCLTGSCMLLPAASLFCAKACG